MLGSVANRLALLFYLVNPATSSFKNYEDIPDYIHLAAPVMVVMFVMELLLRYFVGREVRINELTTSLCIGLLQESAELVGGWMIFWGYAWVYKYRLWDVPYDSPYTWVATVVLVDMCYYWAHRANHEINILWAVHKVHHSAEEYNLTVAVRSSVIQRTIQLGFYHPLALIGIPLPAAATHATLNYLYQFWIHTAFIPTMGPLGWVLMTPAHHRVHHGVNKWCLDKNYGSMFIVWDRMFGTFEEQRHDDEIVYGLTDPPQFKNALWHQVFIFDEILKKARSQANWSDSFKAVFYGPGWTPGAQRLGDPDLYPDVRVGRLKHDPQLPPWQMLYILSHLSILFLIQLMLAQHYKDTSLWFALGWLGFLMCGAGVLTSMYDRWKWAGVVEASRCLVYTVAHTYTPSLTPFTHINSVILLYFAFSTLLWTARSTRLIPRKRKVHVL